MENLRRTRVQHLVESVVQPFDLVSWPLLAHGQRAQAFEEPVRARWRRPHAEQVQERPRRLTVEIAVDEGLDVDQELSLWSASQQSPRLLAEASGVPEARHVA